MFLFKKIKFFLMGCSLTFMTQLGFSETCQALVKKSNDWIKSSNSRYTHTVAYQFNWQQGDARWQGFMQGKMTPYLGSGLWSKNNSVFFSDRGWCPEMPKDKICIPYQPFDYRRSNKWSVTLSSNGRLAVVMHEWNQTKNIQAFCHGNHVYGFSGSSMVHLNFAFIKTEIPR